LRLVGIDHFELFIEKFYEQTRISPDVIAEIFRARLLAVLLNQGVIKQKLIDLLMSWNHNSGFNVHSKGHIKGSNEEAIEKVARYMSRAAISVERVEFNPDDILELSKKNCLVLFCFYSLLCPLGIILLPSMRSRTDRHPANKPFTLYWSLWLF
jgi:hypothetical protein